MSSRAGVSKEMARIRREGLIESRGKDRIVLVDGLLSMNPQSSSKLSGVTKMAPNPNPLRDRVRYQRRTMDFLHERGPDVGLRIRPSREGGR